VAILTSLLPLFAGLSAEAAVPHAPADPAPPTEQAAPAALPAATDAPGEPVPPSPPDDWEKLIGQDSPEALIDGRRRPGYVARLPEQVMQENVGAIRPPPPEAFPTDQIPVPDRYRLIESLGLVKENWLDPYHQNTYKADRPLCIPTDEEQEERRHAGRPRCATPKFLGLKHEDWFLAVNAVSDSVFEPRSFPIPGGDQTSERPGQLDVFGRDYSIVASQTFIVGASLFKGSTAFKPPEIEYRVALAYNINYVNVPERRVLSVAPSRSSQRTDSFLGVQEAFIDYHIRNVSDRYDFDSIRVGIQPFQADFRGFLFNDQQLGVRLFGNRDNNRFQYNLAAFWRLEKDTNSGLNSVVERPRDDFVFIANVYRQDFLIPGLTSQVTLVYNRNREGDELKVDDNGFPVRPALLGTLRPRDYDVWYLGYNVDGHIGRINVTGSAYRAFGSDRNNFFTGQRASIQAYFLAAEASYDVNWARFRLSGLFASGDSNPYDNKETGFDAIFENPVFAGADNSYWIRQSIPFAGGGRVVSINGRNGILNSLRSSKEQGQSNFNNPGTGLIGVGGDFDLTPQFRISADANHLWFVNTQLLQALRNEGSISRSIGWDLGISTIYRPKAIQNVVFRLAGAALLPGDGFRDLFANSDRNRHYYSVLANLILSY